MILRHKVAAAVRRYFDANGFLEIETPILTKSTPEGARDYLVPSRVHPGEFFALPQSPQLFKQILMIAGIDRYVQICKCFRDEDLRADRQPEFTQVDVEMSFARPETMFGVIEPLMRDIFEVIGRDIAIPFPRMSYADAMAKYGSDKPDLRPGLEIQDLARAVPRIEVPRLQGDCCQGRHGARLRHSESQPLFPQRSRRHRRHGQAAAGRHGTRMGAPGGRWRDYQLGDEGDGRGRGEADARRDLDRATAASSSSRRASRTRRRSSWASCG